VTRREIAPLLLGRRITRVTTTGPSYFFLTPPAELARRLKGRRIRALLRHGKYLVGELHDGSRLLFHLGMTGQLFAAGSASVRLLSSTRGSALPPEQQLAAFRPDRHTHLCFAFSDRGPQLYFRDARKFGKVQLIAPGEQAARLAKLGPDALSARAEDLYRAARRRRTPIKNLLLDQSVLAGVGNIYADEALFLAELRPTRRAESLSKAHCERLLQHAQQVMLRAIETGGSSISDYIRPDGRDGGYQDERKVYARSGEPCLRCGTPIKRKVLGQRSAHYCPSCQR
jgi:formamidopyrimidine-DNA glycosylase